MERFLRITLVFVCFSLKLFAQQRPQYTQYMMNQYLLNPAVAGTSEHFELKAGHRTQWAGAGLGEAAPQTTYISGHSHFGQHIGPNRGKHKNETTFHHGVGGIVMNDKTGPTANTSAYLSYAYNFKLGSKIRFSGGASLGVRQFRIDGAKLVSTDQQVGTQGAQQFMKPDLNVGYWLYTDHFYFGASAGQLLQNKFQLNDNGGVSKLHTHYFITSGYKIKLNEGFAAVPSVLLKMTYPTPLSFDVNCKFRYKDQVWAGVSFRRGDSFAALAGVLLSEKIEIGYAYDYGISTLSNLSKGSHEVVVGYRIQPKNQLRSPSDFW